VKMNKLTWLDLYNFLVERANNVNAVGTFDWNRPVLIHDADTGDEFSCDTYYVTDDCGEDRLVLITNIEKIFEENKN
ncbi:MAG: hypothetical protein EBV07_01305, partial [Proteobacteria bacterium]|nr:hypothetical protein [Pseudomonadota bacterium]